MRPCLVCYNDSTFKHYGADVCSGCASFFRRTISCGLAYKCTCRMPYRRKKKGCRHCRFVRCLSVGMEVLGAKAASAVRNYGPLADVGMSEPNADVGWSLENLCYVEFQALQEFCGNYFQNPKFFKEEIHPQQSASHLFAVWILFEQLLATVTHGCVESEVCLTDYNTTMKVEYNWMVAFYRRNQQWIPDADGIARHTVENCSKTLRVAQSARRASLDDKEVTALLQLIIAYYERMFFVNEDARSAFTNRVLQELHDHYKSTYLNYAERLATLLSILGDFHHLVCSNREFYTLITLYRSDGVMEQKTPDQRSVLSFHDLRRSAEL